MNFLTFYCKKMVEIHHFGEEIHLVALSSSLVIRDHNGF
ncbi:hypothetical protein M088_6163 [Bacteroides ovatus str. 3725 D1 iv]|nr:hypothetical protein M088_6163 [Bacteroides ovatus str. 3725 D1 iv]